MRLGSTVACSARRGKHRLIYDLRALMHPLAPHAPSYVHGASTIPLLGLTIGEALNQAAAHFADRDAVVACHQGIRLTYRELRIEADRAARGLLRLGIERGDRVGIWSPNCAEWTIVQFAAAKVGAILVNINPAYRRRELEFSLNQSGVAALITARGFRKTDYVEMLTELMPELTSHRQGTLMTRRVPSLRHLVYLGAEPGPGGTDWRTFLEQGDVVDTSALTERERVLQF